jgi:SAM-dependent methyltransferase
MLRDSLAAVSDSHTLTSQPRGIDVNLRSGPQMREYELIADRIAADRPGRVLDWGCGLGQVTAFLRARGVDTEAFDYSDDPAATEPVRRRLDHYPEVEAQLSPDPVNLPYDDASFDAVLSLGVLEHVPDPDASLEELRRVLKPGGLLYVYKLPNRFSYVERIARTFGLYYHGRLPHDRLYDKRSIFDLLERHGFVVQEFRRRNLLPLTIAHPLAQRVIGLYWSVNEALRYVPGLSLIATNLEAVARSSPAAPVSAPRSSTS